MRFRDDLLTVDYDMGTSGTVSFNVDYSDPISAIVLEFNATNGASGNKNNPIEANISEIQLVDGSDVLWSLPGDVAYGYVTQEYGRQNNQYYSGAISDGQWVVITIPFGRYLYDREYALNPRAHRNPQLKITFDEATIRAAGATGFVSDSFTVTALCVLMEGVEAPRGFLTCKDVYDYTSLASGDTQIDLPTDYIYRQLMLRIYEQGQWFGSNVSHLKLNADGGKFTMFDMGMGWFQDRMFTTYPPVSRGIYTVADDGDTFCTWLGIGLTDATRSHNAGRICTATSHVGSQITTAHKNHDGSAVNAAPIHILVTGWMPQNVLQYNFGRLLVPEEWFDPRVFNSVKLYLTNGNAGAEVNVCLQQLRTY